MTKNNQKITPKVRKSIKWKPGPQKTIKKNQKTIKNEQKQSTNCPQNKKINEMEAWAPKNNQKGKNKIKNDQTQ